MGFVPALRRSGRECRNPVPGMVNPVEISDQIFVKIPPIRIFLLNQIDFGLPMPRFKLLLPRDCGIHVSKLLEINQSVNTVLPSKTMNQIVPVLPYAFDQIAGYPNIQGTVSLACQNVNTRLFHRRCGVSHPCDWIPAIRAGMTNLQHPVDYCREPMPCSPNLHIE